MPRRPSPRTPPTDPTERLRTLTETALVRALDYARETVGTPAERAALVHLEACIESYRAAR